MLGDMENFWNGFIKEAGFGQNLMNAGKGAVNWAKQNPIKATALGTAGALGTGKAIHFAATHPDDRLGIKDTMKRDPHFFTHLVH